MEAPGNTTISEGANGKLIITIEISAQDSKSFLEQEENLARLLNEAGRLATQSLLKQYDREDQVIAVEEVRLYKKGSQKKSMKAPMGG